MMTSAHAALEGFSGKKERGSGEPIHKPKAVLEYTKQMGGVDLSDQLMNYYHFLRCSHKWWRKLWGHLFNMVILNAHVLNKTFGATSKLTHHEYRYTIAAALLNFNPVPQPVGEARTNHDGHWPECLPKSSTTDKVKTRKCKLCFVSKKKAEKKFPGAQ